MCQSGRVRRRASIALWRVVGVDCILRGEFWNRLIVCIRLPGLDGNEILATSIFVKNLGVDGENLSFAAESRRGKEVGWKCLLALFPDIMNKDFTEQNAFEKLELVSHGHKYLSAVWSIYRHRNSSSQR